MFQAQFRGDDSPDDVAARYVEAARAGDRVTLFLLTHPDRDLSVMLDRRVERYREIGAEELTISLEAHSVAAYFVDVRVEHAGRPFDQIGLQHIGRRWYIVNVEE